jgi:hypothetical protein
LKAFRETVKMKTLEGEVKMAVIGDNPGSEEYLQHLNSFQRMLSRKKWDDEMTKLTKAVLTATAHVRKLARTPNEETEPQMTNRLSQWEAAEAELKKAEAQESTRVGLVYDLFRKTLKEDPEIQWDRIVNDMHAKDPWEDLKGAKHDGLRRKSVASLWECIDFHKLTVYSVDAVERQRFYMLCNLKNSAKSIIRSHVTRMETLNKYLGLLPTIKNRPQAVQRDDAREHCTEPPSSCVEDSVCTNARVSSRISEGHSRRPGEYREAVRREGERSSLSQ